MNNQIFKYYIQEINFLSKFVGIAATDFNTLLNKTGTTQEPNQIWYDLQNIILYAGDVSKILWGSNTHARKEREQLRQLLNVRNSWEITYTNKTLRNSLEHIDERLVQFSSKNPNLIVDKFITDNDELGISVDDKPFIPKQELTLRSYNLSTKEYVIFGDCFNIGKTCEEINQLKRTTNEILKNGDTYENMVSPN